MSEVLDRPQVNADERRLRAMGEDDPQQGMDVTEARQPVPQNRDSGLGAVIKLACLAVGGQGGGVLTGWIESVARAKGYVVQATSVAGVAQRTGATIYYMEMAPADPLGRQPVLSLAPAAGDVDIMIAAEMMEAGRAIMRGFVTPDRTVLIGSTHRALAVSEKVVPGDGIADSEAVLAAAGIAARRAILFDMDRMAVANGSVISATLFGALAGSGALPFARADFEQAIRDTGKGVEPSLRAFAAAYDAVQNPPEMAPETPAPAPEPAPLDPRLADMPEVAGIAAAGLAKVEAFQDRAYGDEYISLLRGLEALAPHDADFLAAAAKHVANAMAYDDVIRVAREKTRSDRMAHIAREMRLRDGQVMQVTEFFHPRAEEIVGMFPARLGARIEASPRWMGVLNRLFGRGRRIRSDRLLGYWMLHVVGSLRGRRRGMLRHRQEVAHRDAWLAQVRAAAPQDPAYATELLNARRLVKGYSDTHARGLSKFDRVMAGAALVAGREDAADWTRRLIAAALQDEKGTALDGAIETIRGFAGPG